MYLRLHGVGGGAADDEGRWIHPGKDRMLGRECDAHRVEKAAPHRDGIGGGECGGDDLPGGLAHPAGIAGTDHTVNPLLSLPAALCLR